MYRTRVCFLLLLSLSVVLTFSAVLAQAQQPGPQQQPASHTDPSSSAAQPPQTQSMGEANSRIQRSVEDLLNGDPQLSSADLNVAVDDHAITLTGAVDSYTQHQRVMALVQQYSRYRQIVDKLKAK